MDESFRARARRTLRAAQAAQSASPRTAGSSGDAADEPLEERPPTEEAARPEQPASALVSWAHTQADWDRDATREWERQVAVFTTTLRTIGGIDADVDLYHAADTGIDWTRFGPSRVAEVDFVLVILSQAWAERWAGTNKPTEGAGAVGEADALHGMFQRDQSEWQRRVKLIVFPGVENGVVPLDLARLARFPVDPDDIDSYDSLLRALTAQPLYVPPPVTAVPVLPPAVLRAASRTPSGKLRKGRNDQELLQAELLALGREISRLSGDSKELAEQRASLEQERTVIQSVLDGLSQ